MCRRKGPCMRRAVIIALALLASAGGRAQVSGYASAAYSYHSNPLFNYAAVPDHPLEGYWQLDYLRPSASSDLKLGYLGGLMVFRGLAPRTYYEHRASIGVTQRYPSSAVAPEGEEEEMPFRGNTLELGARLGARHDREEYRQFDNWGVDGFGVYTWGAGTPASVALSNETDLRRYATVPVLDNLTTLFSLRISLGSTGSAAVSLLGGAGIKHYLTSEVDTSVFQTVGAGASNGAGKGKGRGIFAGTGNGKKDLLVNVSSVNTIQLNIGIAAAWQWKGGSAQSEFRYRIDPGSTTRVLAQYANSTLLSEDLYNDFFSHAGPELTLALRQKLAGLSLSVDAVAQRRKYLSPAFTLDGLQSASARIDLHAGVEISLTRSVALGESLSLDIGLTGGALRNQSNDAYNDFSAYHYGVVAGLGF